VSKICRYCCRNDKKPAATVDVGSSVLDTKLGRGSKEHTTIASVAVGCRTDICSSPSKRMSPADVSGTCTNEEWETASEGSDGGLHQRRPTTHREDAVKYSTLCNADFVKPCVEPDGNDCSQGRAAIERSSHHSPCASGVPSPAPHTDFEHSWNEASSYQCRPDVGSSVTQRDLSSTGCINTDSADVAVNHSSSSSLTPSSLLFAVSFSDPGTKQPSLHDALVRFDSAPNA